jgi:hypothetical protein
MQFVMGITGVAPAAHVKSIRSIRLATTRPKAAQKKVNVCKMQGAASESDSMRDGQGIRTSSIVISPIETAKQPNLKDGVNAS